MQRILQQAGRLQEPDLPEKAQGHRHVHLLPQLRLRRGVPGRLRVDELLLGEDQGGRGVAPHGAGVEVVGKHTEGIGDPFAIPDCGMTAASRGTVMGAQSVRKAGEQMHRLLLEDTLQMRSQVWFL